MTPSKSTRKRRKVSSQYTEEAIEAAVKSVQEGKSQLEAARLHSVPRSTLQDRLSGRPPRSKVQKTVLTKQEEGLLVDWIKKSASHGFERTKSQVLSSVQAVVKADGRSTPFKDGKPGYKWFKLFMQRHSEIATRTSQKKAGVTKEKNRPSSSSPPSHPTEIISSPLPNSSLPLPPISTLNLSSSLPPSSSLSLSSPFPTSSSMPISPSLPISSTPLATSFSLPISSSLPTSSSPLTTSSPLPTSLSHPLIPPTSQPSTPSSFSVDFHKLLFLVADKTHQTLAHRIAVYDSGSHTDDPEEIQFNHLYGRVSELVRHVDGCSQGSESTNPNVTFQPSNMLRSDEFMKCKDDVIRKKREEKEEQERRKKEREEKRKVNEESKKRKREEPEKKKKKREDKKKQKVEKERKKIKKNNLQGKEEEHNTVTDAHSLSSRDYVESCDSLDGQDTGQWSSLKELFHMPSPLKFLKRDSFDGES